MRSVRVNSSLTIGQLTADALISGTLLTASDSEYRLLSVDLRHLWTGLSAAGDSGLAFGFAFGDYTDTEIFECLTAANSIDRLDKIAQEKANRLVRLVGILDNRQAVSAADVTYNDGKPTKVRLNWFIPIGGLVKVFVWNQSAATIATGTSFESIGKANLSYQ